MDNNFELTLLEGDEEALNELKGWLFQENIRLNIERKNLESLFEQFLKEKKQFQSEMHILNQRVLHERKRLKEENRFFEKKMEILQNGFRELEEDRRQFEREKLRFETERKVQRENFEYTGNVTRAQVFFRGVTNQLALKKRYKDLMKIFHPDNLCGDNETVLAISKEYEKLRKEYDYHKEA
ncbi:MAG: hypothetical protein IJ485_06760 [Lachnospiraceae bacterium]|nr:hypothetical protein [Lachnospiraceae bacterium]